MGRARRESRPRLDVNKDDAPKHGDLMWSFAETPTTPKGKWKPYTYFGPERTFKKPKSFKGGGAPLSVVGKELGVPEMSGDSEVDTPERTERSASPVCMPKIYLGDASPAPRWLVRPAGLEIKQDSSRESCVSSGSKLPPLGKLRWELDPGMRSKHGLDEAWLRDYAYQYLLNSLGDPIVRDQMRDLIWNGPHAPTVAHVEDPLPVPPPPPHFKDKKPSDYVSLQRPVSASASDDYYFMYPAYERPPLAARVRTKADVKTDAEGADSNTDRFSTDADDSSDLWSPSVQDCSRTNSMHIVNSQPVSNLASTRRSSASTTVCLSTRTRANTGRSWYSGVNASTRTRAGTGYSSRSCISTSSKEFSKRASSEDSVSPANNPTSDDDDQHISPGSSEALSVVSSSEDERMISRPPKRGKRRTRKNMDRLYVDVPALDELSSEALPPRKKRRTCRTQDRHASGAFLVDEDIPLPKLPKKKMKKKARNQKAAKRR